MQKLNQTEKASNTSSLQKLWPFSAIAAFFHPVSEQELKNVIQDSEEQGRKANELLKETDALHKKIGDVLNKPQPNSNF